MTATGAAVIAAAPFGLERTGQAADARATADGLIAALPSDHRRFAVPRNRKAGAAALSPELAVPARIHLAASPGAERSRRRPAAAVESLIRGYGR